MSTVTGYTFIHNGNGYCRSTREEAEELLKDRLDHSKFFGEEARFSYCGPDGNPIQYARLVIEEGHLIEYLPIDPAEASGQITSRTATFATGSQPVSVAFHYNSADPANSYLFS